MMEGKEHLYYALGELAYAVAKSDGKINREERAKLHEIVEKEAACSEPDINISEITFHLLQKDNLFSVEDTYQSALRQIKLYNNYLSSDMRADFPAILEKVAMAFEPFTSEEENLIERFRQDLKNI
jgi:uncharacterized tellurite resistance protein B-like protein